MDRLDYRERLRGQIEESCGKLSYTYQTQQEAATLKRKTVNRISISQIILTAVSTCGVISVIIGQTGTGVGAVVASITSALSLGLNLYTRGSKLPEEAEEHVRCANRLWVVLQDYESLLTDFDDLEVEEIRRCRDLLIEKQAEIYDEAPRTSDKAYEKARDRLKNGHQSFEPGEIDKLLPSRLRSHACEE